EIVQLVMRNQGLMPRVSVMAEPESLEVASEPVEIEDTGGVAAPRTGVEVVASEKRNNNFYHDVRDLRNGNIVRNVTRQSARKLWHYAITQAEDDKLDLKAAKWHGDIAVLQVYTRAGKTRYDLAQRANGTTRIYYGVTEDGIQDGAHTAWREILNLDDED